MRRSNITKIPNFPESIQNIEAQGSMVEVLPEGLTVRDSANFSGTPLKRIEKGIFIPGSLDIADTKSLTDVAKDLEARLVTVNEQTAFAAEYDFDTNKLEKAFPNVESFISEANLDFDF